MRFQPRRSGVIVSFVVALIAGCASAPEAPRKPVIAGAAETAGPVPADAIDISKLDVMPAPVFQARPQYPAALHEKKVSGQAVVDFIVDANGDVRNAYALRATHPDFGAAAVASVMKWKFKPGRKGGRAVPTHMQVPIMFALK